MSNHIYQPETYNVRNSVGYLVKLAYWLNLDAVRPGLAEHGLTFTQYAILLSIHDRIALDLKSLSLHLHHDTGALSRVLNQLEARGLVLRQRSAEDRRAIGLSLTGAGKEGLSAVVPLVVNRLNKALEDFTHVEADELLRLLKKLVAGWQIELGVAETAALPFET